MLNNNSFERFINGRDKIEVTKTDNGYDVRVKSDISVGGALVEGVILLGFLWYLSRWFNIL